MSLDPWSALAGGRMRDLQAEAETYRMRPRRRRRVAVPAFRRVYARLWWAARPRAAAWTPGLFES